MFVEVFIVSRTVFKLLRVFIMSGFIPPEDLAYQRAHIHEERKPVIIAVCVALLVLGMLTVILRIVARGIRKVEFAADDYLIFLAQVSPSQMRGFFGLINITVNSISRFFLSE